MQHIFPLKKKGKKKIYIYIFVLYSVVLNCYVGVYFFFLLH